MSLIIKGMEMPQSGDMIICGQIDGKLQCTIVTRGQPTKWCEASEVSAPHGRLIDADEHIKSLKEGFCGDRCRRNHDCFNCGNDGYIRIVENEPTVIKAEGVNE